LKHELKQIDTDVKFDDKVLLHSLTLVILLS